MTRRASSNFLRTNAFVHVTCFAYSSVAINDIFAIINDRAAVAEGNIMRIGHKHVDGESKRFLSPKVCASDRGLVGMGSWAAVLSALHAGRCF